MLSTKPRNWKRAVVITDMRLPYDFHRAVRMLSRPYFSISEADASWLEEATKGKGDIFKLQGCYMTWGVADGGYHLMNVDITA